MKDIIAKRDIHRGIYCMVGKRLVFDRQMLVRPATYLQRLHGQINADNTLGLKSIQKKGVALPTPRP